MKKIITEYFDYRDRIGNRVELYRSVAKKYNIDSAIYPGSHIDIAPSLVIPKVSYIDNFKGAIRFFNDMESIKKYLDENKDYVEPCEIEFIGKDYHDELEIVPVDLIISQYAGFVGQATKKYFKIGGILLCNDSHGDATLAKFDNDFEFIGIVEQNHKISSKNLEDYFILPKNKPVDIDKVRNTMKGPKYQKSVENYIFKKVKSEAK